MALPNIQPGHQRVFERRARVASAAVLTLDTAPVEVIPALGEGYMPTVLEAVVVKEASDTAYVVAGANARFELHFTNAAGTLLARGAATTPLQSTDETAHKLSLPQPTADGAVATANAPVMLTTTSTGITAGDADVIVVVRYIASKVSP